MFTLRSIAVLLVVALQAMMLLQSSSGITLSFSGMVFPFRNYCCDRELQRCHCAIALHLLLRQSLESRIFRFRCKISFL